VLLAVLLVVRPEVFARAVGISRVESESIQFVVAHDCKGRPRVDHRPNELQRLANLWSTVDEVAEEDRLSLGMAIDAHSAGVTELLQEPLGGVSVAADVTDEVVHSCVPTPR
jgi:hypothetical protein